MSSPRVVGCVLLAERHHDLTAGVCGLLKTAFEAVVMVADEASLLESAGRLKPSVLIVDLSLEPSGRPQWLERLRPLYAEAKLILLSVHDEPSVNRLMMEAGADAFVLKRAIATDLLPAVDAVLHGKRYISPGIRHCDRSCDRPQ